MARLFPRGLSEMYYEYCIVYSWFPNFALLNIQYGCHVMVTRFASEVEETSETTASPPLLFLVKQETPPPHPLSSSPVMGLLTCQVKTFDLL